ncbi:MAG: hypothetical protein AAB855_04985 [Patescibacteria group bacterium]
MTTANLYENNHYSIPVVVANPALNERQFLHSTEGADAIIFVVHASGAVGKRFGDAVATRSSAGIPVFMVSNNPGDSHGILDAGRYGTTEAVLKGGGIPIQRYNINDVPLLLDMIKKHLDNGLKGDELAHAVTQECSYKEGEEIPVPEWETPERIKAQKERTRQTLRRTPMPEKEAEEYLNRWESDEKWLK